MIEKPIDVTLEAADRIIAAERASGKKVAVVPQHRFDRATEAVVAAIQAGDLGRLEDRDLWWQLSALSTGGWSLAGAWAILALTSRRGTKRFLFPLMVSWVSSGMLFAYNLFFSLRADSQASPEHPLARVLTTQAGIVLGLLRALACLAPGQAADRRRGDEGGRAAQHGADHGSSFRSPASPDDVGREARVCRCKDRARVPVLPSPARSQRKPFGERVDHLVRTTGAQLLGGVAV